MRIDLNAGLVLCMRVGVYGVGFMAGEGFLLYVPRRAER